MLVDARLLQFIVVGDLLISPIRRICARQRCNALKWRHFSPTQLSEDTLLRSSGTHRSDELSGDGWLKREMERFSCLAYWKPVHWSIGFISPSVSPISHLIGPQSTFVTIGLVSEKSVFEQIGWRHHRSMPNCTCRWVSNGIAKPNYKIMLSRTSDSLPIANVTEKERFAWCFAPASTVYWHWVMCKRCFDVYLYLIRSPNDNDFRSCAQRMALHCNSTTYTNIELEQKVNSPVVYYNIFVSKKCVYLRGDAMNVICLPLWRSEYEPQLFRSWFDQVPFYH